MVFLFVVPLSFQGPWGLSATAARTAFLAPATAMALARPVAGRIRTEGAVRAMAGCLPPGAAGLCARCHDDDPAVLSAGRHGLRGGPSEWRAP